MKGVIWDLVKDIESVINKNGNKPSEKRCVCRFCENPLQGGTNVFQAHHRVYGTGKKTVKLCKSTPADVKARLQQEIDVQHVAEHRREGDLLGDTNCVLERSPCRSHEGQASM